ncbi:hypothetical protein LTR59_014733 [Friedmanniomyces endolithicus]|nr:hypothetical protein LTR94_017484 [Friedmanniomyces endolithicus]KAK0774870.1 hypothetical protein LTR59_014733 [Friedmanniomyces endolithicus]KAK0778990.1 hypothetical protein LTR38_014602 [Friedmanniomyces endolithicus]
MADPLSATSALVGLVTFSYQASKGLRDTINSFKQHPKYVRDLQDELSALEGVLLLLEQSLATAGTEDYQALEYPIQRCGHACHEFQQALQKCLGRVHGDASSFRAWLKIRWIGNDIHGFRDTLAGYKSTIAIAMAGVNLLTVIQEYKDMIQSTKTDLQDHLYDIDNKLRENAQERSFSEDNVDGKAILAERASTVRCLEICIQVSNFIDEQQERMGDEAEDPTTPHAQADAVGKSSSARQIVLDSFLGCKLNIKSANAQLSNRLEGLSTSLTSAPANVLEASPNGPAERERMVKEIEGVRKCLDICMQATNEAEKARINVMEDITTAEDSRQVLVSTIGDLIAAHRVTAGPRSLQAIGQMSDESLQHLSRTSGSTPASFTYSADESRPGRDSHTSMGRTLGSSKVRTL